MITGDTSKTSVEYFLLMHDTNNDERLVYYDKAGTRYETNVSREVLEEALRVFDGKRKAIRRSSGGLSHADPYQLVILDHHEANQDSKGQAQSPELLIKVKFKEFKRDGSGKVLSDDYITNTKLVHPSEITDPFSYALDGQQRFALDFGAGLIPVYVFHYDTDPMGNAIAYFIDIDCLRKSLTGQAGEFSSIQPYAVAREVLRFACDLRSDGTSEYLAAMDNLARLKESDKTAIPREFSIGEPVEVSFPHTHQSLRNLLRKQMGFKNSENTSTTIKATIIPKIEQTGSSPKTVPQMAAAALSVLGATKEEIRNLQPFEEKLAG
jgi:hypothetical protein